MTCKPFNIDRFRAGLETGLKNLIPYRDGIRCRYGWIGPNGHWYRSNNEACHAAMSYPPSTVSHWGSGHKDHEDNTTTSIMAIYNVMPADTPKAYLDWVTDKERSPWRALLEEDFFTAKTPSGDHVFIIPELNHSSQFLTSFMKSMRMFSEYPAYGATFTYLTDNGVNPTLAWALALILQRQNKGSYTVTAPGWHGSSCVTMNSGVLQNLLNARFKVSGKTYAKEDFSYMGVDSIFDGYGEDLLYYAQKALKLKDEYVETRFSGRMTKPKWTDETVLQAAQILERDFVNDRGTKKEESVPGGERTVVQRNVGVKRLRGNKAA